MIDRIGHYRILSELGRGGMGVVYKAHEESLNRFVAIKVLGEHLAADPSYVQRFLREAQSAARLNHPNIVQIHVVGEDQSKHYFVMEYVHGKSLQQILRSRGSLSLQESLRLVLQAAAGLAAAHDLGVIHRDIKPANLLVDERGLVKIADFGLALMHEAMSRLTATGMFMGTPGYLAPEQCSELEVDQRADIYSLGVTLFECLTGRAPFSASSPLALLRQIIEVEPPDVCELNPGVDQGTRDILRRMMAKDREQRFANCHELINTLQPHLDRLVAAGMGMENAPPAPAVAPPVTPLATPQLGMELEPTIPGAPAATPPPMPPPYTPTAQAAAPYPAAATPASSSGMGTGLKIALAVLVAVVLAATATVVTLLLVNRGGETPPAQVAARIPATATPEPPGRDSDDLDADPGGVGAGPVEPAPVATSTPIVVVVTATPIPTRPDSISRSRPTPSRPQPTSTPTPRRQPARESQSFPAPPGGVDPPVTPTSTPPRATPTPDPLAELVAKLDSGDGADQQFAAKRLYRSHRTEARVHQLASDALLAGFDHSLDDERHVDAMAWLCNILGASGNPEYSATLSRVVQEAENRKIRRFAEKNLKALR